MCFLGQTPRVASCWGHWMGIFQVKTFGRPHLFIFKAKLPALCDYGCTLSDFRMNFYASCLLISMR